MKVKLVATTKDKHVKTKCVHVHSVHDQLDNFKLLLRKGKVQIRNFKGEPFVGGGAGGGCFT